MVDQVLEMGERLGDGETPLAQRQAGPEQRDGDLGRGARPAVERAQGELEPFPVVRDDLVGACGGVGDRLAVAGEGDARLERRQALERVRGRRAADRARRPGSARPSA